MLYVHFYSQESVSWLIAYYKFTIYIIIVTKSIVSHDKENERKFYT